ncbi:choice-of-anchor tandem repeat GloVer-containing protein [Peristeroidobacter soli]|uniref:choice-of-anchor tandem repeat GloVer-containing protein n=1 Tax=Peristeroidobacter soli TaxID=2497877 RepID=UPI00101B8CA7|nr:choice-of-anchor tandem repeat GloVer-containing protein [Peristeroidobacter soli]
MNRSLSWLSVIPLTVLLAACGGGDGDSASAPANTDGGSTANNGGNTANNGGNTPVDDTYSIGGTVSGLPDGAQLSLLDNGANAQSITSNGPFTLTEKLSAGSAYSVTLGAKPTGYQCNVTGAAGTMPASNITDVAIACTQVSVTVGGSITGLDADGLAITNGNDTLEIPANATTFTLPTAVAGGTLYNIAVSHIPTAVHCDVSNASGTADDTPVDNVRISCGPATLSTVYSFQGSESPAAAAVTPGRDGNLYGVTDAGQDNTGTVYKITPDGSKTVLWTFGTGSDGWEPWLSPLLEGNDGNFYGITEQGGTYGSGTVYRITPAGAESVLWSFGGPGDGWAPTGKLLQASDGNFYGVTQQGGPQSRGTIFRLTPDGEERVMLFLGDYDLDANRYSGLIQGRDGNLYGQAQTALFKMTLDGTLSIVSSYDNISNFPLGSIIQANDGNFYGVTQGLMSCCAYGAATLFRVTPSGAITVLHTFGSDTDPDYGYLYPPTGAPFQAADGKLYGLTNAALYSVTLDGTYTVLHTFQDEDETKEYYPIDTITQGADGTLYGVTKRGGPNDNGSVFKLN